MKRKSIYCLRSLGALAAYAAGLLLLNHFYTPHQPHKYWLVLLPGLPLIYLAATIVQYVSELDELWRKVVTEAMAFSGVATAFTSFSYLFVRDMGAPEFHGEWAFYLCGIYYGIGLMLSWWRYR